MEIIGYIGYAALCFFAITWAVGVRAHLDAGIHTILGALFFLVSAVVLLALDLALIHSLWLIVLGFISSAFILPIIINVPIVSLPFTMLASIYASIIRVGIPTDKIRAAQNAGMIETIEEFSKKHSDEE